jgi:hypothetical protein
MHGHGRKLFNAKDIKQLSLSFCSICLTCSPTTSPLPQHNAPLQGGIYGILYFIKRDCISSGNIKAGGRMKKSLERKECDS